MNKKEPRRLVAKAREDIGKYIDAQMLQGRPRKDVIDGYMAAAEWLDTHSEQIIMNAPSVDKGCRMLGDASAMLERALAVFAERGGPGFVESCRNSLKELRLIYGPHCAVFVPLRQAFERMSVKLNIASKYVMEKTEHIENEKLEEDTIKNDKDVSSRWLM